MVAGKYSLDFTDKILFLEELGFETDPEATSNNVYYMKQNGVFDKIKGLGQAIMNTKVEYPLKK